MSRHDETQWRAQIKAAHERRVRPTPKLSRHYRQLKPYRAWNAVPAIKVVLVSTLALVAIIEIIKRLAV